MSQIFQNLYLGSIIEANNVNWLRMNKITHIVNFSNTPNSFPNLFDYWKIDIDDMPTENISRYFQITSDFIDLALKRGGRVLVHCMAGISRSSTILIAYLVLKKNFNLPSAYNFLKKARPIINPNPGFITQLKFYFNHKL